MIDRISLILRTKNINASQFADEIGVQRSSISHVLSGRNKPSLEFVQRILKRYPEINPDWLLFGKGAMHQESNLFSDINESIDIKAETISKALGRSERGTTSLTPKGKQKPLRIKEEEDVQDMEDSEEIPEPVLTQETVKPPVIQPPTQEKTEAVITPPKQEVQEKREAVMPPSSPKEIEKIMILFKDRSFREYSPE